MAEYIKCRNCESPDCKGCNLKRLETMLENGKFDCMMNENRCINTSADVEPVQEWISVKDRLPEPFVSVLAFIQSEEPLPTVHESYIEDHSAWVCILTAERYKTGEVTHWMPMPSTEGIEDDT